MSKQPRSDSFTDSDFVHKQTLHIRFVSPSLSPSTPDPDMLFEKSSLEGLCFRSYASEAFQSLRSRQDIPLKDFSVCLFLSLFFFFFVQGHQSLITFLNAQESLTKHLYSELGVSGRSGSFLYITKDKRFIIKTLTHSESKFLRTFFRQYYEVGFFSLLWHLPFVVTSHRDPRSTN
jgi:hypothetical protein